MGEHQFDYSDLLNELRCHTTEWLEGRRGWLVREQRRLHIEELAVLGVLDERGRIDDALAAKDGKSVRDVRRARKTAKNLADQPNLANAAARGRVSEGQLHHLWPRSWGSTDHIWNLATVCAHHHRQLVPQGETLLLGNPNNPAGLSLVHRDDLPMLAELAATEARAGPEAA